MAIDKFPNSAEDDEYKNPLEDEDEDEESEDGKSKKRKKSFLDSWLKRDKKAEGSFLFGGEEAKESDEDQSIWKKMGSFLRLLGGEEESEKNEHQDESAENQGEQPIELGSIDHEQSVDNQSEQTESTEYEEMLQNLEQFEVSESVDDQEEQVESAEIRDDPTFEEMPEETPRPDDFAPAEEVFESEDSGTESADLDPPETETSGGGEPPEPPEPPESTPFESFADNEPESVGDTDAGTSTTEGGGYGYTRPERSEPTSANTETVVERREGANALDALELLAIKKASKHIKDQGKKIEKLRKKVEKNEVETSVMKAEMLNRFKEQESKLQAEAKVVDGIVATPIETIKKPEVIRQQPVKYVEKIKDRQPDSPVNLTEKKLENLANKEAEEQELQRIKKEALRVEAIKQQNAAKEKQPNRQPEAPEVYEDTAEKGDYREIDHERSHEIKQYSATPLADIIDESGAKQLVDRAARQSVSLQNTSDSVVGSDSDSLNSSNKSVVPPEYRPYMIAGSITAIVILAAYFVARLLT